MKSWTLQTKATSWFYALGEPHNYPNILAMLINCVFKKTVHGVLWVWPWRKSAVRLTIPITQWQLLIWPLKYAIYNLPSLLIVTERFEPITWAINASWKITWLNNKGNPLTHLMKQSIVLLCYFQTKNVVCWSCAYIFMPCKLKCLVLSEVFNNVVANSAYLSSR